MVLGFSRSEEDGECGKLKGKKKEIVRKIEFWVIGEVPCRDSLCRRRNFSEISAGQRTSTDQPQLRREIFQDSQILKNPLRKKKLVRLRFFFRLASFNSECREEF